MRVKNKDFCNQNTIIFIPVKWSSSLELQMHYSLKKKKKYFCFIGWFNNSLYIAIYIFNFKKLEYLLISIVAIYIHTVRFAAFSQELYIMISNNNS